MTIPTPDGLILATLMAGVILIAAFLGKDVK